MITLIRFVVTLGEVQSIFFKKTLSQLVERATIFFRVEGFACGSWASQCVRFFKLSATR